MNADDHAAYLNRSVSYFYDPRDRISSVQKTDQTGNVVTSESYVHDANSNVTNEVVGGVPITHTYDRNRLVRTNGPPPADPNFPDPAFAEYLYDPFGRMIHAAGFFSDDHYTYDGFDRVTEFKHEAKNGGGAPVFLHTRSTYDSIDRTSKRTEDVGLPSEHTLGYDYNGLSNLTASELNSDGATTTYEYGRPGDRLGQVKTFGEVEQENTFYSGNAHTDTEALTDDSGATKATYGYTAYGRDDTALFTGADKPDPNNLFGPLPYNIFRFNAKPLDRATGTYDMGARDYSPAQNQFLTRDSYGDGAGDLGLVSNPAQMNRYAFAGGNPIGGVEIDGHCWSWLQSTCNAVSGWIDGALDATVGAAGNYIANLYGAGAGIACPSVVGYGNASACGGAQEAVTGDIQHRLQIHVPLGADVNSRPYKIAHFVGEITGIPLPGGITAGAERLAARMALRGASRKAAAAGELLTRAHELHGLLDPVAQDWRVTAIIRAWTGKAFVDVVAGSGDRGLDKVIQNALKGTERVATNIKGLDAEETALRFIEKKQWTPFAGATTKPVCPWCQNAIFRFGGKLIGQFYETVILRKYRTTPNGAPLTGQKQFIF